MTRRLLSFAALVALCAAATAVYVFRAELVRLVLVTVAGGVAWRILLVQAGVRRPRGRRGPSRAAQWIEALSAAWIALHFRDVPRARRERIDPAEVVPISSLQPVYFGQRAPEDRAGFGARPAGVDGPGDEIPF